MQIPPAVLEWLEIQGYGCIVSVKNVGGGCINNGANLKTETGRSFFIKTNSRAPVNLFVCEAEGLRALRKAGGPGIPEVFLCGEDFLLMEDLAPAPPKTGFWGLFGRQLAVLHTFTSPRFGFHQDNYIGSTPQPNPWTGDGYVFFAEHRLLFQANLAFKQQLFGPGELKKVERLTTRLPSLIPSQPASLIHGDLWSGNAISNASGEPALIDPATHFGWAEAELAMTGLFGGFGQDFYLEYNDVRPLEPGWRQRFEIYNLYHLLNHLNIFGNTYLSQVMLILNHYV